MQGCRQLKPIWHKPRGANWRRSVSNPCKVHLAASPFSKQAFFTKRKQAMRYEGRGDTHNGLTLIMSWCCFSDVLRPAPDFQQHYQLVSSGAGCLLGFIPTRSCMWPFVSCRHFDATLSISWARLYGLRCLPWTLKVLHTDNQSIRRCTGRQRQQRLH